MKLFKNVLTYYNEKVQYIHILADEKFLKISTNLNDFDTNIETIDLLGKLTIPGAIDSHVHFNDPGFTDREDFTTGTTSAAFGGITTIIDMPCTSLPPVVSKDALFNKLNKIKDKAVVDFAFWGGLRGNDEISLQNMEELWNEGIIGFKTYTISGMETYKSLTYKEIEKVFEVSKSKNFIFGFHAEDFDVINDLKNTLNGEILKTVKGYTLLRPEEAEIKSVKTIVEIAKKYNSQIHIVHISTKEALDIVTNYEKGSAETCPHYLQFTQTDLEILRGRLKTAPVVKKEIDKKGLREGLLNGKIKFITTDHAGCDFETEKQFDDFSKVYNGIPGIQVMIPYLFSEFYVKEKVSLKRMIEITSENVAKFYGLYPQKGVIAEGSDADFTIIDFKDYFYDESTIVSKGKYSPFNRMKFHAFVSKTIVRGNIVFDNNSGLTGSVGFGKFIKRIN